MLLLHLFPQSYISLYHLLSFALGCFSPALSRHLCHHKVKEAGSSSWRFILFFKMWKNFLEISVSFTNERPVLSRLFYSQGGMYWAPSLECIRAAQELEREWQCHMVLVPTSMRSDDALLYCLLVYQHVLSQPLLDEQLQWQERAEHPMITHLIPSLKSHQTSPGCPGLCRELQPWGSASFCQCSCSAQVVFSPRCWTRIGTQPLGTGGDTSQWHICKTWPLEHGEQLMRCLRPTREDPKGIE